MLQALPCIIAAQVLDPAPGSRVLDMCAAPGGKTTCMAQQMKNDGTVMALDRTHAKVAYCNSTSLPLLLEPPDATVSSFCATLK